jgi:hypothetical protein
VAKSYALTDGVGGINFSDDAYFMIRKISVAETIGGANSTFHVFDNISVTSVPEPSSTALLGLGGLALILRRRK